MKPHKRIYLQPDCHVCGDSPNENDEGRLWCQDDVWSGEYCESCGASLEAWTYLHEEWDEK